MTKPLALVLSLLLFAIPGIAQAQAPAALPARIDAQIGLPGTGPARYLNVSIDLGSGPRWSITGCVASAPGACAATATIPLDDAGRRELVQRIQAMQARMRCPPPRPSPGDPTFTISTPSDSWVGALPRDPAQIPARTAGVCAASEGLAWWLVQRFGVPGLTAPEGG